MTSDTEIEVVDKQEVSSDSEPTRPGPVFVPLVDIFEDVDGITVVAEMPGASSDGIEIDLDKNTLSIAADVAPLEADDETDLVREWTSGRFYRQFTVPDRIDQERIEASLTDGVLRLRLPKMEQAKPRKITVNSG